ncbi:MAG: hypothetical protein JSV65_08710 [Armatimonadota bacterium]|nr:MAG: hypothetical protein JSV65_08710 [Armatimonadota bacterium]
MPPDKPASDRPTDERGRQEQESFNYGRYRMNPVQVEESQESARAVPRRIGVFVVLLAVVAVAVLGIWYWDRLTSEQSPLESLDPEVREQAQELVDNLLTRIESLQGHVYDVQYPTRSLLRVFVNPTVLEASGEERRITDEEVERVTERVVKELRKYAQTPKPLTVEAYVVDDPSLAAGRKPAAVGTYDPETDSMNVELTTTIPVPEGEGTGEAPPGKGHLGERGGGGMPQEHTHSH